MRKALIPGSFDPVTVGHEEIIRRAAVDFDRVTVGIFVNPEKTCLFTEEERVMLLKLACRDLTNVDIRICGGYTADFAKAGEYTAIVRGYRNKKDIAYENRMASFNRARGGVPTLLFPTKPEYAEVSSTVIREKLTRGEDISALVPRATLVALISLFDAKQKHT